MKTITFYFSENLLNATKLAAIEENLSFSFVEKKSITIEYKEDRELFFLGLRTQIEIDHSN